MTKQRKKITFLIVSIVALCMMLCFGVGITYSKYVGSKNSNSIIGADNFYFSSDLLSESGSNYNVDGGQMFSIDVRNYTTSQLFNTINTTFRVEITGGNVSGGNPVNNIYTIIGGGKNSTLLYITPTENIVNVSVSSISPYAKTLSGTFTAVNTNSSYSISAVNVNSTYVDVVLNIARSVPTITLSWDTTLYNYDPSNALMSNAVLDGTTGTAVLNGLVSGTAYIISFYLKTAGTYAGLSATTISNNSITITLPNLS